MKQKDKVLQLLREAGPYGVHTFELRGQFIGNPSQRIADLEADGHRITHTRERLHGRAVGTRYMLVGAAGTPLVSEAAGVGQASATHPGPGTDPASTPAEPLPLFDPTPPPVSPYDDQIDTAA